LNGFGRINNIKRAVGLWTATLALHAAVMMQFRNAVARDARSKGLRNDLSHCVDARSIGRNSDAGGCVRRVELSKRLRMHST